MKLLKFILIELLVVIPFVLSAQLTSINCLSGPDVCSQKSIPIEPPIEGKADTLLRNYIPYYYYQFPLEINVNLFFIQKDNGTGNFQENDEEHQQLWDEITAGISKLFTEFQNSKLDSCFAWKDPFWADSYIRLKFNRYYFKKLKNLVAYDIPSVGTMAITQNLNWNGPFRCYSNLDINSSGRLTMQDKYRCHQDQLLK